MSTLVPLWFSCPSVFGNWRKIIKISATPWEPFDPQNQVTCFINQQTSHAERTSRANPFPKVTDLFSRLPSPTFIRSTRVSSTWGPAAVMGTKVELVFFTSIYRGRDFQGWWIMNGHSCFNKGMKQCIGMRLRVSWAKLLPRSTPTRLFLHIASLH